MRIGPPQRSRRPRPADKIVGVKLSVIMPVFNVAATIEEIIERVRKAPVEGAIELIVVDAGSTDGTRELLAQCGRAREDVQIALQELIRSQGAAIRRGVDHAKPARSRLSRMPTWNAPPLPPLPASRGLTIST